MYLANGAYLIDRLDQQNDGRNFILFDVYFGKLF